MSRILVVDDREMMRDSVATTLTRKGHQVVAASNGKAALAKMAEKSPDVIVTDLQMPEMNGLELLVAIRKIDEQIPVILMTAYGTIETAVAAMKQGAFDYITKPFSGDELLVAAERAIEHGRLLRENQILRASGGATGPRQSDMTRDMVGSSPAMSALKTQLARIADSHGTVLITGESGSGKEVAARWIHANSPRAEAPFLALNCAALSTSLLESELFGHEKGAFTGADRLRKGRFELADGGTLLLDEISEIAPEIQAKLLRVLQERAFERVGSSVSKSVDVRVIATTNRDLQAEAGRGRFREDLFFRLNVLPLAMPPLRQRIDDLDALISHFISQVARREGKPVKSFEPPAMQLLRAYHWPGNVRELQNVCERAAVLADGPCIRAAMIEPWLTSCLEIDQAAKPTFMTLSNNSMTEPKIPMSVPPLVCDGALTLETIEREAIVATLHAFNGHRQKSAEALGIGVRTLGLKLKKWKEQKLVEPTL
jgi:DNA-binding NtrC family response regulator